MLLPLSIEQRKLLAIIEQRADLSIASLSIITKIPESNVRQALKDLEARKILGPSRILVDLSKLGFVEHGYYLKFASHGHGAVAKLNQVAKAHPDIVFALRLLGSYDYLMCISTRSVSTVQKVLHDVLDASGIEVAEKMVSTRSGFHYFGRNYLWNDYRLKHHMHYGHAATTVTLDETDRRVLKAVYESEGKSQRTLAAELGMPTSSLNFRIKKLEDAGVIVGRIHSINPSAMGLISMRLLLKASKFSHKNLNQLMDFCNKDPRVVLLAECIGSWDYELGIDVSGSHDLDKFLTQFHEAIQNFPCQIEKLIVSDVTKEAWLSSIQPAEAELTKAVNQ